MKIKRFGDNGCLSDWSPTLSAPQYDDVVDKTQFRPDSENVRINSITGAGASGKPVYDGEEIPSDLVVQLRSGKFDKAEVSQMQLEKQKELEKASSDAQKQKELDELKKINDARQTFLDEKVGFSGIPQSE